MTPADRDALLALAERVTFRLTDNIDPEERLEEAALWKAVYDASGGTAVAVTGDTPATFGRLRKGEGSGPLQYWSDPAFLREARRSFVTLPLDEAVTEVRQLHARSASAFVKSTRDKHAIFRCPVGQGLYEVMEECVYSFIDGGPMLMVQELALIEYEWRFFCIDRQIVADSTNHPTLTPLDYPMPMAFRSPASDVADQPVDAVRGDLLVVAERIAATMRVPTAVIDCAYINGQPGCVELNPLRLGQVGLFASDVRSLAAAALGARAAG